MTTSTKRARGAFLGAPVIARGEHVIERFRSSGNNFGNLFIGAGMTRLIDADFEAIGSKANAPRMRERVDFVAIAAANFLSPQFDLGFLADIIEALDLPCVMMGLGAQAPRVGDKVDIPAGTRRMLDVVSAHCHSIGVRGANTAQVMSDLGFKNAEVLGCPSLYCIGSEFREPDLSDLSRFMINGSYNVAGHSMNPALMREVESALYRQALDEGADYILQNEYAELEVLNGEEPLPRLRAIKHVVPTLQDVSDEALLSFVRERCKTFSNTVEWVDYARSRAVSVGTRFHGNVAALQAGTPAFFICHDARTTEMCEFAALPHASIYEVEDRSFRALAAKIDLAPFQRRQSAMHAGLSDFLQRNGVPWSREALLFASGPNQIRLA